jgi:hypothetical protein
MVKSFLSLEISTPWKLQKWSSPEGSKIKPSRNRSTISTENSIDSLQGIAESKEVSPCDLRELLFPKMLEIGRNELGDIFFSH